jgi:HEAT repeat protein
LQSETPVINALTNENQIIRQAALYALANPAVTEAAVGPLVSLLKTNNPDCLSAMTALAQIRKGTNVVVPALLPLLQAKNSSVRQYALETLCAYKVPAKILLPTFMDLLSDTNPAVRHAVIEEGVNWVLENEECDTVVPALIRMLNDPDPDVRSSVVDDLGHAINEKLYGGTHPYLLEHLQARPLGDFAPQANMIVPAIINSLSDTNAEVRDAAARALADIGPFEKAADAKIVAALIPALRDENKNVSAAAASALENFGAESKDALPVLAGLTNSDLAWNANDAMSRIRADDYRLQLDDILRKKFPRLDWVAAPIKKTAATHWSVETNRAPGISTSPILFKRATFKMTAMGNHPMAPASIDFVTFKTPAGKIWMGWDMDFYVETDTGIIGGILAPYGTVYWHDDLARPMDGDLDDVISRFMQRVDNGKIKGESNRETSLSGASNYFFEIPGTAQGVMPKFLGLTVEGKEVQLDLENPQTGRKASFWIDLGTWKVIKAI